MNNSINRASSRDRKTLPALTGIRFFAAFYVVSFRALPWLQTHFHLPWPLREFLSNGHLAVALFFLLSGFILSYTYEGLLLVLFSIGVFKLWEEPWRHTIRRWLGSKPAAS